MFCQFQNVDWCHSRISSDIISLTAQKYWLIVKAFTNWLIHPLMLSFDVNETLISGP